MRPAPCLTLTTDFGLDDPYVAEVKAAVLSQWARFPADAPRPPILDLGHAVPAGDVAAGSWFLRRTATGFPAGSVHLAVIDPGVGSERPGLALRAGGRYFVGPGNGLFAFLAAEPDLQVTVLDDPLYHRDEGGGPAPTFHGRDIFAVAAAHLAMGVPLSGLGSPGSPDMLGRAPNADAAPGGAPGRIVWIDRFGNAITDISRSARDAAALEGGAVVTAGGAIARGPVETFAAAGRDELFWYWGSGGTLEIALRDGDAAAAFGLAPGMRVTAR